MQANPNASFGIRCLEPLSNGYKNCGFGIDCLEHRSERNACNSRRQAEWETDFYTPPVLGGVAFFDNSAPAVYKNSGSLGHRIFIHRWR